MPSPYTVVCKRVNFRELLLFGKQPPETEVKAPLHGNEMN